MTVDATAQALVGNEPAPVSETPQIEDDGLAAAFDKFSVEPEDQDSALVDDKPVETAAEALQEDGQAKTEADPAQQDTPQEEKVPSDVPAGVKNHWKDIPEAAREGIVASQRSMSQRLAEATRQFKGIEPIRDELVRAIKDNPSLAELTPAQMAQEVTLTAKMAANFRAKPVETLLTIAKENRIEGQLVQALQGAQPAEQQAQDAATIKELRDEIAGLKKAADPVHLRQTLDAHLSERAVQDEVQQFANAAEHWQAVENHMPLVIPLAQAKLPNASNADVLKEAYAMAVAQFVPGAKAHEEAAAAKAAAPVDPARTEAAKRAISTNVKGSTSGKAKELSEEDTLSAAFDRAVRR